MKKILIRSVSILLLGLIGFFGYPYIRYFINDLRLKHAYSVSSSQMESARVFDIEEEPIKTSKGGLIGFKLLFKVEFPKGQPVRRGYFSWVVEELPNTHYSMGAINPHFALIGGGVDNPETPFLPGRTYQVSEIMAAGCVQSAVGNIAEGKPLTGTSMFWMSADERTGVLADSTPRNLKISVYPGSGTYETKGMYSMKEFYDSALKSGVKDNGV